MERLTEHHVNKTLGAYMACSMACIDDDFDCNNCEKLAEMVDRLAAYEDIGTPEEINHILDAYGRGLTLRTDAAERLELVKDIPAERLQELAQAEKDARLVVLPFCVGSSLYEATGKGVREYETEQFSIGSEDLFIHALDKVIWYRGGRIFGLDQIGKTVFLTREAAEAALKKREADDDVD